MGSSQNSLGDSWLESEEVRPHVRDQLPERAVAKLLQRDPARGALLALRLRGDGHDTGVPFYDAVEPAEAKEWVITGKRPLRDPSGVLQFRKHDWSFLHDPTEVRRRVRNNKSLTLAERFDADIERAFKELSRAITSGAFYIGIATSVAAMFFAFGQWKDTPDAALLVVAFTLSAAIMRSSGEKRIAALFAVCGGAYAESLLARAGANVPPIGIAAVAPALLWSSLLHNRFALKGRVARAAVCLGVLASAGSFLANLVGVNNLLWVALLALAMVWMTQRAFKTGVWKLAPLRICLIALAPATVFLVIDASVGLAYGDIAATTVNMWLAVAPVGCAGYALAERHGTTDRERA